MRYNCAHFLVTNNIVLNQSIERVHTGSPNIYMRGHYTTHQGSRLHLPEGACDAPDRLRSRYELLRIP